MQTVLISDMLRKARYLRDLLDHNKYEAAKMTADSLIIDVMALETHAVPHTESEARDGGDCVCERCQQEEANGSDGLCQACRDMRLAQGVGI
jgi:hypothetical protein